MNRRVERRWLAIVLTGFAFATALAPAHGATSCDALLARRKISIVVPFKAGGGYDAYARVLAPALERASGARVAVANIAGATGVTGIKAVAAAPADALVIGLFDLRAVLSSRLTDHSMPPLADFVALGSLGSSTGVWATRDDTADLLDRPGRLTAAASTGAIARMLLPAMLLDREVDLVRGFAGSADRWLALLRRDVDVVDGSDDSIQRSIATSPGTRALLLLADKPSPDFPGVRYLAGAGGMVDQQTAKLGAATRRSRMELAQLAVDLASQLRTLAIGRHAPESVRACVEAAVDKALFDPALREAAAQQKLGFVPAHAVSVRENLSRIESVMAKHQPLLKRLATAS
jgi:hypothetical protein